LCRSALSPHGADDDPPALSSTTVPRRSVVPKEKPNQACPQDRASRRFAATVARRYVVCVVRLSDENPGLNRGKPSKRGVFASLYKTAQPPRSELARFHDPRWR